MKASKPRQRAGIVTRYIDGALTLCDATGRALEVLTPTTQVVWQLCDGEHSAEDIAAMLRGRFAVPEGHDIAADVREALDDLRAKGLLQDAG